MLSTLYVVLLPMTLVYSMAPIVQLPEEQWDGVYKHQNQKNITTINLKAFRDLVEQIHINLLELAGVDNLEIVLKGGYNELLMKYSNLAVTTLPDSGT